MNEMDTMCKQGTEQKTLNCRIENLEAAERQEKLKVQKIVRETQLILNINRCHVLQVLVAIGAKKTFKEYSKEGT